MIGIITCDEVHIDIFQVNVHPQFLSIKKGLVLMSTCFICLCGFTMRHVAIFPSLSYLDRIPGEGSCARTPKYTASFAKQGRVNRETATATTSCVKLQAASVSASHVQG